ncbi:MAG: aldehyde dehydrogenase family protein [Thermomicrobiales bacterium]
MHERRFDEFVERLLDETSKIVVGDPLDRSTDLGPMIDDKAAKRTQTWVDQAVADGAPPDWRQGERAVLRADCDRRRSTHICRLLEGSVRSARQRLSGG